MPKSHDQLDALLTDTLDGNVQGEGVDELAPLDSELHAELEHARAGIALLNQLAPHAAPARFERRVQQRVRRRTGGRYFSPAPTPFGFGVTIDAFVVLAVAIMSACWFMTQMPVQSAKFFSDPPNVESKQLPTQAP